MRTDLLKPMLASLAIALGCAMLFCAFGCSKKRDIPTCAPHPPLTAWLAVSGESMLPNFPNGTLAEIRFPVDYDSLEPGQVVVFWAYDRGADAFTFHRLIRKQGDQWISQGDNPETNARYDAGWVTRDNLYAVATGKHAQILNAPAPK